MRFISIVTIILSLTYFSHAQTKVRTYDPMDSYEFELYPLGGQYRVLVPEGSDFSFYSLKEIVDVLSSCDYNNVESIKVYLVDSKYRNSASKRVVNEKFVVHASVKDQEHTDNYTVRIMTKVPKSGEAIQAIGDLKWTQKCKNK